MKKKSYEENRGITEQLLQGWLLFLANRKYTIGTLLHVTPRYVLFFTCTMRQISVTC